MLPAPAEFDYAAVPVDVAAEARDAALRIRGYLSHIGDQIFEIGRELIHVKATLGHGNFLPWLASEFAWSESTAKRYMSATRSLGSKSPIVSYLPPTTIYNLSATETPDALREEIVNRLESGERLSAPAIDHMVTEARRVEKERKRKEKATASRRKVRKQEPTTTQKRIDRERQQQEAEMAERNAASQRVVQALLFYFGDDLPALLQDITAAGHGHFASHVRFHLNGASKHDDHPPSRQLVSVP